MTPFTWKAEDNWSESSLSDPWLLTRSFSRIVLAKSLNASSILIPVLALTSYNETPILLANLEGWVINGKTRIVGWVSIVSIVKRDSCSGIFIRLKLTSPLCQTQLVSRLPNLLCYRREVGRRFEVHGCEFLWANTVPSFRMTFHCKDRKQRRFREKNDNTSCILCGIWKMEQSKNSNKKKGFGTDSVN